MSMRRWLPAVLGLLLVALLVIYAAAARRSPVVEGPAPAERDPSFGVPEVQDDPGRARRRFLPHVPADPGVAALGAEQTEPVADDAAVVAPIAPSPETAERDQQIERLRASGPDVMGLTGKVQSMQADWQTLAAKAGIDVQVSPLECHQAGCFSTLVFKARDAVEDLTSKIFDSRPVADWPGPKTRSTPLARPDGGAEVTWLLLPPGDASAGAPAAAN